MTMIEQGETLGAETATSQSRREALKKFGRYAAAAPAAMILLQPSVSHADLFRGSGKGGKWGKRGKGGKWGKRGKGGRDHY
jgi:hypothetical protein